MTREGAIYILSQVNDIILHNDSWLDSTHEPIKEAFEMAVSALEEHQERKKGKWIGGEIGYCSCCGHKGCASDIWNGCDDGEFCPNCGADMRQREVKE